MDRPERRNQLSVFTITSSVVLKKQRWAYDKSSHNEAICPKSESERQVGKGIQRMRKETSEPHPLIPMGDK